ncbi:MAG: preprotein translocase subunit SecE, partial [Mariprofundus sp.]
WPERKETMQATLMVFVMVIFIALFLWLIDSGLSALVQQVI